LTASALARRTVTVVSVSTAVASAATSSVGSPPWRPAVVAHRGASADVPEHTLAAYEQALLDGADGLEADVRLTRDGHLVCVHDRRVERTSDGRGAVSALALADLSRLDFGSWRSRGGHKPPQGHVADGQVHRVLTLAGLLDLVTSTSEPVTLALETKHPTRWAGLVEQRLAAELRRFGLLRPRHGQGSRVRMMSFSTTALRRARALMPALEMAHLTARPTSRLPAGTSVWGPSIDLLRRHPDRVAWAQAQGRSVHVWTVDHPEDMRLCADLGVDAVITNRPALARAVLGTPP
jgi:glycerophosphoryl diester phosphodiesterase